MARLHELQHLQPVQAAALQPDVEEDQVRPARLHRRQGLVGIARGARAESLILEDARDEIADVGLVIDNQDIGAHELIVPSLDSSGANSRRSDVSVLTDNAPSAGSSLGAAAAFWPDRWPASESRAKRMRTRAPRAPFG